jgi:hypothetical protein
VNFSAFYFSVPDLLVLTSEAELLDEIQTNVLRVFLLASHRHLNSFALRCLFLQTHATLTVLQFIYLFSTVQLVVKEAGGKPDRKQYPLPFSLRNPYGNLKSENSQDYAQKPQRNCTFMNSASGCLTWKLLERKREPCSL